MTRKIRPFIDLFIISFLILFFEMVQIRWISSNIRVVSYFSNIILISCFLGFGVGCIFKKKRSLFVLFPHIVLIMTLLCFYVSNMGILNPNIISAYFFGGSGKFNWLEMVPFVFMINTLCFICLGQKLAQELDPFAPLQGYSINILGSLAGTLFFSLMSFQAIIPTYWFALSILLTLWLMRKKRTALIAGILASILVIGIVHYQQQHSIWSAYNKIQVSLPDQSGSFRLVANDDYHQLALNLSNFWTTQYRFLMDWRDTYDFPYHLVGKRSKVLVLGAGMGNDVAAALRNGAQKIDAVELDPVIFEYGRIYHPEHPFNDPRVSVHITDARLFINHSKEQYDAIVLGWLDSHRLFSSMSNVRQDNFVYTLESFQKIRTMLKPDGVMITSFYVGKPWIGGKLFGMIRAAFGFNPQVYAYETGAYKRDGQIFVIGATPKVKIPTNITNFSNLSNLYQTSEKVSIPTDNWPFLYYKERTISGEYIKIIGIILVMTILLVLYATPVNRISLNDNPFLFFFLGAGFLLMEVRNIISLALIYGSTWVVASVVIAMTLIMVYLSNGLVEKKLFRNERVAWLLLFASLTVSLFWNSRWISVPGNFVSGLITTIIASLSFLFAGIVFSFSFARVETPSIALGFNILGSVIGGLTEYFSLLMGIRGLLIIALLLYGAAFVLRTLWEIRLPKLNH